jgi:hypothetical protein
MESNARHKQEVKELDEFFVRTKHPSIPYFAHEMLTDYITELE